jgi:hypothetical protein
MDADQIQTDIPERLPWHKPELRQLTVKAETRDGGSSYEDQETLGSFAADDGT